MDTMAVWKKDIIKTKETIRKKQIEEKLSKTRKYDAKTRNQNIQLEHRISESEEENIQEEVGAKKDLINLSMHPKYIKR